MGANSTLVRCPKCRASALILLIGLIWICPVVLSRPHNNKNNNNRHVIQSQIQSERKTMKDSDIIVFRGLNNPIKFGEDREAQASDTVIQFVNSDSGKQKQPQSTSKPNKDILVFPIDEEDDSEDESLSESSRRHTTPKSKTDTEISHAVDSPSKQTMASADIILSPDYLLTTPATVTRFIGANFTDPKIPDNPPTSSSKSKSKYQISSQEIAVMEEKLSRFVTWVKGKGLPENFVEATRPSSPIDDTQLDDFNLSNSGTLKCPNGQKKGPGGVCQVVANLE